MAADRLSGLDTAFLCLDSTATPMNIGAMALFAPTQPVHPTRIVEELRGRAERIPRLRQRVRGSVLRPGSSRWVDDARFDVDNHIVAHHLPRPHDATQLTDLVAEIMATRLDPVRPLWSIHVITGLPGGWFALLPKLHHALADGAGAVVFGLALMDDMAERALAQADTTTQPDRPGLVDALRGLRSASITGVLPETVSGLVSEFVSDTRQAMDIAGAALRSARPVPPSSPLLAPASGTRRLATVRLDLADIKRVRGRHGGTTNDVLLAVLSGALRDWLADRGDRPDGLALRAMIPVNQRCRARGERTAGNQLSGYLCDLPVAEPDPVRRLMAVRQIMDSNKEAGPTRGPGAVPVLADRIPPAVHRLLMRAFGQCAPLLCDTVVTSVPLPNMSLRFDGAELREVYPVVPLAPGHALSVAFSSYRSSIHVGLHADAAALPDIDGLARTLSGSLDYLIERCA